MADPSLLPEGAVDAAKFGSTAIGGGVFTMLLSRIFGTQEKTDERIIAELKLLTASVGGLSQQVAVLSAGTMRRDSDVSRLEVTVTENGKSIAKLEALVQQMSEGLIR
jgi:hypothetical protein